MSDLKTNLEQILQEKETKIIPANIKKGIQIFDVEGALPSANDATATVDDIVYPKTAYVGENIKITGNMTPLYEKTNPQLQNTNINVNKTSDEANPFCITFNSNYIITFDNNKNFVLKDINGSILHTKNIVDYGGSTNETIYKIASSNLTDSNGDIFVCAITKQSKNVYFYIFKIDCTNNILSANYHRDATTYQYLDIGMNVCFANKRAEVLVMYSDARNTESYTAKITKINEDLSTTVLSSYNNGNLYWISSISFSEDDSLLTYNLAHGQDGGSGFIFKLNNYAFTNVRVSASRTTYTIINNRYLIRRNQPSSTKELCSYEVTDSAINITKISDIDIIALPGEDGTNNIDTQVLYDNYFCIYYNNKKYLYHFNEDDLSISLVSQESVTYLYATYNQINYSISTNRYITKVATTDKLIGLTRQGENLVNTSDATVTSEDIAQDKIAYNQNGKVVGTVSVMNSFDGIQLKIDDDLAIQSYNDIDYVTSSGNQVYDQDTLVRQGSTVDVFVNQSKIAEVANLTPDKIKKDETILGVTGTYEGEGGDDVSNYINLNPTGTSLRFTSLITKVPEIDTSSITNMSNAFSGYSGLKEISLLNTSNVTNMYRMFYQCNNLTIIPEINTSKVTNMESTFDGCSNLTTIPQIDTSKVTNMESMFDNCSKLTTIPQIDTSKTKTTERMFFSCRKLTTIPQLDMSNNITMRLMFNYCESLVSISLINTSNVTDMVSTFSDCSSLTTIIGLDTSNATNIYGLFSNCSSLTTIPEINTSSATTTGYMFKGCSNLTTIPEINTSKVQDMNYMFSDCTSLTTIPQIDTSKVENMSYMFDGCSKLETVPMINTSSVTNMYQMFRNCTNLTTIPKINTSNVTNMDYMFNFCNNLTTIPQLNMNNVSSMISMFNDCVNLSNDSLNNILASLLTATSYTGAKTLNRIGLSSTQATTCTTLSNWSACEAAGWTTGY